MMEQITVKEIVEACGGTLLCGDARTPVEHISIDSRTMKGNDLFVPLIGEKVDAHRFLPQAISAGAVAVLTSEQEQVAEEESQGAAWIMVTDTKKALQEIGAWYRRRLSLPLIGVTGSVGKTTTREMISAALSAGYQVYKTPGNHNSQVGVPITLSEITSRDQVGVIELGMSEPGELTVIARIAQVDMAVITNIGVTHIEQLGTQEHIYNEKLSIQDGLKPGGTLFLNGDDEWLKKTRAREGFHTVYYGLGENCDYRAVDVHSEGGYPAFTLVHGAERVHVVLQVMGAHQILNALVALAVADANGVPMEEAAKGLKQFTGFEGRQQVAQVGGLTVIDDTYNASPVSMRAAIDILVSLGTEAKGRKPGRLPDQAESHWEDGQQLVVPDKKGRRIAVLADMKELGVDAPRFHYEIGEYLAQLPVDITVTYGELALEIAKGVREHSDKITVHSFSSGQKEQLEAFLDGELKTGDSVLFKGSNSMKLGEVVKHVRQHHH